MPQGLHEAQSALGALYDNGKGVKRNHRQAVHFYAAAANLGYPLAENNLASMFQLGHGVRKDLQQSVGWYQNPAEHGEVTAQCNPAYLYFRQTSGPRLCAIRELLSGGRPAGVRTRSGKCCPGSITPALKSSLNYSEAAKWVRVGTQHGYARAQRGLGYLYEQGKGVALDYMAAYMWYTAASNRGESGPILNSRAFQD